MDWRWCFVGKLSYRYRQAPVAAFGSRARAMMLTEIFQFE